MDFKFLEIGTRIAIGQFDATIIEYDMIDGFSGLFPVYVVRFDTGETEPVHHTDITGLIYDNPMPVEVIEGRKAYRAEHGDDAPDPQDLGFIPPKAGCYKTVLYGNEGEQDLYTVESVWPQHPQGTMYLIERRDSDNLLILHYVLERYLKPGDNPDMAVFDADAFHTEDQLFEQGDVDDYDQLRIERGEFETENYQLKQQLAAVTADLATARRTQETMQGQITDLAAQLDYAKGMRPTLEKLTEAISSALYHVSDDLKTNHDFKMLAIHQDTALAILHVLADYESE